MTDKLFRIEWKNEEDDWNFFYLLEERDGFVKLRGADDPTTGSTHKGDVFWAALDEILVMREWTASQSTDDLTSMIDILDDAENTLIEARGSIAIAMRELDKLRDFVNKMREVK